MIDKKQVIIKKIDVNIEIRKLLWATILILTGGIIGLGLSIVGAKDDTLIIIKSILLLLGFWFEYIFISCTIDNSKEIAKFIKQLESEE